MESITVDYTTHHSSKPQMVDSVEGRHLHMEILPKTSNLVSKFAHYCQQPHCFQIYPYLAEVKPIFACIYACIYIYFIHFICTNMYFTRHQNHGKYVKEVRS